MLVTNRYYFKIVNRIALLLICFLFTQCATTNKQSISKNVITGKWIDKNLLHAASQYKVLAQRVPANVMPRSYTNDTLRTCTSENWVAGFYPGTLLYLYENTKDIGLYNEALTRIKLMDKEQYNKGTHDLGFMMYCSYGNLNRINPNETYKKILINSARSLASRFNPAVGCIRSWGRSNDTTMFRGIIIPKWNFICGKIWMV